MNLLENVLSGFSSQGVAGQLAQRFGLDPSQVSAVMAAAAPHVASGMQTKLASAESEDGGRLQQMVNDESLQGVADNPEAAAANDQVHSQGQSILSHVFGGGEGVSNLANTVASRSGVSQSTVQMLLPAVTALLAGSLARHAGGDTGQMGQILGAITGGAQAQTATSGGLLGALEGAAGNLFRR